jgi:hypothetical protein
MEKKFIFTTAASQNRHSRSGAKHGASEKWSWNDSEGCIYWYNRTDSFLIYSIA